MINGLRDGTGKQIWPYGSVYEGEWMEEKLMVKYEKSHH